MSKSPLHSEKGLGLIQVVAALAIASVAMAGLFLTSFHTRKQAVENYHYRAALLAASAKLDLIRYHNRGSAVETTIDNIPSLHEPVMLDEREGIALRAGCTVRKTTISDLEIAPYVVYDAITVELTWREESDLSMRGGDGELTHLILREDYYRKVK